MSHQRGDLPPDRWGRVKELFGAALEHAPLDRGAFLDQACGTGDGDIRREVEALLAAHQASNSFLDAPVVAPFPPPHGDLEEGQTLGPYRILRILGRGGMATVYMARDERHRRAVALKVLLPELAHALGPERFLREIEVEANLTHPHILPLHDSGEAAGLLYYVMPYIEGESLRDRLKRETQLPLDDALQIAREVADALAYAHGQGVVHRDIKPENILLSGGHALVADFGIARVLGQAGSAHLTETGMAIGTVAYMSPEQASAVSHIDGRSDVYSLGCVVYEMLAGEPPYAGPTAQAIIAKRFSDPVPRVRRVRPSVPEHVERAVTQALAPLPADRFATAADFAHALQLGPPGPTTGHQVPLAASRTRGRRVPAAASALALGVLIGLGVLFAWRRSHPDADASGAKLLAVLPFENLGDSADAYFADGVANDLRTKLSQVAGLQVIARGSSNEYRGTAKTQQQIARELGVDYLLTATVQWEKGAGGASQVRVTPELVDVRPGHAPQTRWGQQFDAAMTGVFQVQADIAGRVAQALNVALGDSVKHQLATRPTESLPAYDAYLRGWAALQRGVDPPAARQALDAFERAVALDSTFSQAWASVAVMQAQLYYLSTPTRAGAEATRRAAERARALAPDKPAGHYALARYYQAVLNDGPRGLTEDSLALALSPGDAAYLAAVGQSEFRLGRWEAARGHLEQAARLDPRNVFIFQVLGNELLRTRHYPEAKHAFDHALQLTPADLGVLQDRAMVALAQGDLAGAQSVIKAAPKEVDPTALVAFMATYNDLYWVLDEPQQRLLLRLTASAFDGDRGVWGAVFAQAYAFQGNTAMARVYADSARPTMEQQVQDAPEDAQRHTFLGLISAYLGHKEAAIREGKRGVTLLPITRDAGDAPYIQHQLVRIYLLVGEPEKALDQLEPLLKMPYFLSPAWLKIDPNFAPLRGNPRFERLVQGK
jgi:serine/threonine protein kinase/TolB-like protein/tetratricopeptide (TPR) repeat protein